MDVIDFATGSVKHELSGYTLDCDWNVNTINWENQPPIDYSNNLFKKLIKKRRKYELDLTDQVTNWYDSAETNYGMILVCSEKCPNSQIEICTDCRKMHNLSLKLEYSIEQEVIVVVEPTEFCEYKENIIISGGECFTKIKNVSLTKTIAYFLKNNGCVPIKVSFEYSPDGIHFNKEYRVITIKPKGTEIAMPLFFSKYIRLSITKPCDGNTSIINTWLQVQK
jgi:hypothetical protein